MDKGIYTALSGGIAKSHELELIANNLANANTPGYKRDTGTFNEYLTELRNPGSPNDIAHETSAAALRDPRPQGDKSFVEMDGVYTDYAQGTVQKTGRTLDLAVEGGGFFEILTPGGIRYTRQGNFSLAGNGQLVTTNGYPVLAAKKAGAAEGSGDGGLQERMIRLGRGAIEIAPNGIIRQNGVEVATIGIQEFHEPQWLEKAGNSYYRNIEPKNLKANSTQTALHQGFIESSNVNAVREMTRLIEVTRAYESHMQAIKTYQEIDSRSVNSIAGPR